MARRTVAGTGLTLLAGLAGPALGQTGERARPGDILVANLQTNEVALFDGETGTYRGAFITAGAGIQGGTGLAFGPDGDLYVSSSRDNRILRFDGATGEPRAVFVEGGELESPFSLIFGPDGDLYVSSGTRNRVLRYDGRTGAFAGVAAEGGGLEQPIGLAFGPHDGMLYVVNSVARNILRFDPASAEPLGTFATDSLAFPSDVTFGPDGHLYVSSATSRSVIRLDGRTGAFIETYVRLPGERGVPMGIAFKSDGTLIIGDFGRNRLYAAGPGGGAPRLLSERGLGRPENVAIKPR